MTKYAEKFGRHSFKFGAEIERSHVRSQYQPYGPSGFYIYQYDGVPYGRYSYGYDVQGDNHRTSAYVQDQWSAGHATLNIGLRMDRIRGNSPVLNQDVYKPKTSWGPRVGIAYDLTGNDTAALKAFWGRYYEGAASAFFTSATPGIEDYTGTPLNGDGSVAGPTEVIIPGQVFGMGDDLNHPRTDEFNVSYEQQLAHGMRFTATGIWRWGGTFLNSVIRDARWSPTTLVNPLTNEPLTAYNWANIDASNNSFIIRNTEGFQYLDPGGSVILTADPTRKYRGLMLVLTNSLRGRFGFQASYVLSKAEGNVDNSGFYNYFAGGSAWSSLNNQVNSYGELTNSRRHEIKLYFTYRIPVINVMLGGNYTGLSGRPYTATYLAGRTELSVASSSQRLVFLQPRGSEQNDFYHNLDLRIEKAFEMKSNRFGIYADITNLTNRSGITGRQARYPSSGGIEFGAPTSIQDARQVTFGARWMF